MQRYAAAPSQQRDPLHSGRNPVIFRRNFGATRRNRLLAAAEGRMDEGEQRGERGGHWKSDELRRPDPGELGRLKRLTGLLLVNGSETI